MHGIEPKTDKLQQRIDPYHGTVVVHNSVFAPLIPLAADSFRLRPIGVAVGALAEHKVHEKGGFSGAQPVEFFAAFEEIAGVGGVFVGGAIGENEVKTHACNQFQYPEEEQKRFFHALYGEELAAKHQHKQSKQV